jgi:hypothetical protein
MFAGQTPTHDPESMKLVLLMIVTVMMIFWRTTIKLAMIAAILLAVFGAFALFNGLH